MSTHPNDPSNGFDPSEHGINAEDLAEIMASAEFRALDSEPKVRDFNMNFADLLGECPNTASGKWLTLEDGGSVIFHIKLVDVLRLSTAIQKIAERISLDEVRRSLPSRRSFMYELVEMVRGHKNNAGEMRRSVADKSVHLGNRKVRKNRRKGA